MALIAVLVYVGTIDRVGRRLPVYTAYTILTILLFFIVGLFYSTSDSAKNVPVGVCGLRVRPKAHGSIQIAMVCIWQPCFSLYAKSYYIIASELPSLQLRSEFKVSTLC